MTAIIVFFYLSRHRSDQKIIRLHISVDIGSWVRKFRKKKERKEGNYLIRKEVGVQRDRERERERH